MDIDILLDILDKYEINNANLAEDLFTAMTQVYRDGYFDGMEDLWYTEQDQDTEWVKQWLDEGESVHMESSDNISYQEYEEFLNKTSRPVENIKDLENTLKDVESLSQRDIPPGLPIDREEDEND